ncbi:LysR family transcriptional regulator [Izhakiella australiensis]|uniref:LysR family transcriptional regulator n=1 Tax=Izhakiella australiensis TaxID=1926881 RepID=A0A1S8YRX9_9GAMM|nr:LysR family transcriptional regulator [Izhakiella australiensis]OON41393.1 LysR family transcriptional regulator [Izhakiella australiensis]
MDFYGLDLNLLVAFDALLSERHVSRAAQRAGVSQPAMSAALGRLRRHFNDPLFIRAGGSLSVTPRAQEIGRYVTQALSPLSALVAADEPFLPTRQPLSFNLAMAEYAQQILLPSLMRHLQQQAPEVTLHVQLYNDRDEAVSWLDSGKADAAIGIAPTRAESRIATRPLLQDSFATIVRRSDHNDGETLSESQFLQLGHILVSPEGNRYGLVDEQLRQRRLQRNLRLTLQSMFTVPAIVAGSDLAATLLKRVVLHSAFCQQLRLFEPPLTLPDITFCLIWHRRSEAAQAQHWLRELISAVAAEISADSQSTLAD